MSLRLPILLTRLREHSVEHRVLPVGSGAVIVVSALGGRVYGPFWSAEGTSENWIPADLADPGGIAARLATGTWNLGGDRLWVGPEIAYMIPDRQDYWGSYTMPPDMDPGTVRLLDAEGAVVLEREMRLRSHRSGGDAVSLRLVQQVRPEPSPLRHLSHAPNGVSVAGYSQRITLEHRGGAAEPAESWNLAQVRTPGVALLPSTVSPAGITDYYEPVGALRTDTDRGALVRATGRDRFKIGITAAHTIGRVGYVRRDPIDGLRLMVRSGPVDPAAAYPEEPDFAAHGGDPVHVYADDGGLGGFAELEHRGRTIGGESSDRVSTDRICTWWFTGDEAAIAEAAHILTGMPLPLIPDDPEASR